MTEHETADIAALIIAGLKDELAQKVDKDVCEERHKGVDTRIKHIQWLLYVLVGIGLAQFGVNGTPKAIGRIIGLVAPTGMVSP